MSGLERDDLTRRFLNLHPDTPIDMTEYALPLLMVRQLVEATAAAEREACATFAQEFLTRGRSPLGRAVGDAIRARGNDAA
jgi:hypothetical protein